MIHHLRHRGTRSRASSGALAAVLVRSTDVCLSPDSGGIADIPQPPLGAMCGRLRVSKSFLHVAGLVGPAMCSAFKCGSHHMTAGHNALRGSGPGQQHAFDNNAMAQVGCPDRRIDRHCITCCSPFQPLRHAGLSGAISLDSKRDRFLVALTPGHHGPRHASNLVGERDGGELGRTPCQQSGERGVDARSRGSWHSG
jgi:hypothetical protein